MEKAYLIDILFDLMKNEQGTGSPSRYALEAERIPYGCVPSRTLCAATLENPVGKNMVVPILRCIFFLQQLDTEFLHNKA